MSLSEESAKKLILAADEYHADDLIDECAGFLETSVIADDAIGPLNWANQHALARLKQAALEFIARRCQRVRRTRTASSGQ